jgi:hypothetical protein
MTDLNPGAPLRMVEWSRTAACLLRAIGRAYPHHAPAELKATADRIWELASRGAILQGTLEAHSKALERLADAGVPLRAEITRRIEAATTEAAAELRAQLARYDQAFEKDCQAGRDLIAKRVEEAHACEKAFNEGCAVLVEHLRQKPACHDVLDELPSR